MVFISLLLILFTQVSPFRGWLADKALSYVNDALNAEISVSDLYLNPFTGVEVWDATMIVDGDTLAYIEKITVDADFFDLLSGKITVSGMELEKPKVKLQRKFGSDKWNFELIAKPTPEEPPSPLPELIFDIKNLVLNNATVKVRDFNNKDSVSEKVNFVNLEISNMNILLNAYANLKELDFGVEIDRISFKEKNSGFELRDLALNLKAGKKGINLKGLAIKTPHSNIKMQLDAENVNVFENFNTLSLLPGKYRFSLDADKLSPKDIRHFVDYAKDFDRDIALDISLAGTIGEMLLEKFNLAFGGTAISMKASGTNLAIDKFRTINIDFDQSNIELEDLKHLLPKDIYSSIPSLEFASIESLSATYSGNDIAADFEIRTGTGTAIGNVELNIADEIYKGRVTATNLNISGLAGSASLESDINANVDFSGNSFDFYKMETKVTLNSQNSRFTEYGYGNLTFAGRVSKGVIYSDTLILLFGTKAADKDIDLVAPETGSLRFNGFINLRNRTTPDYAGTIKLKSLNLKEILGIPDAPNNIDGEITVTGSGLTLDDLNGKIAADISYLEFRDKAFMPFRIDAGFESIGTKRKFDINSSFMNLSVEGNYSYENLISLIETQGSYLAGYIKKNINNVDFSRQSDSSLPESVVRLGRFKPFELKIKGQINDLSPMTAFIDSTKIVLNANLDISVNVNETASSVKVDSLVINNFFFETPGIKLAVRPTQISAGLMMDIRDSALHLTNLGLKLASSQSVLFNEMEFYNPIIILDIADDITNFNISGSYGNDIFASAAGSVTLKNKRIDLAIEKLNASYQKILNYHNTQPILADVTSSGFNIRQFEIMRDTSETISISGKFNDYTANDVKLRLTNLSTEGYNKILPVGIASILKRFKGKIENLEVIVSDSLINPDIKLQLQSSNLLIDNMPVGSLQAFLHHSGAVIKGSIGLVRRSDKDFRKLLSVDVNSLPINLALKNIKERIHDKAPLNVSVYTDNLPLHMFTPFLSGIADNLKGNLDFSADLYGSLNKTISYLGKVKMNNAFFHLIPNNMNYYSDADIELKDNLLSVKNIEIRNNPIDMPKGRVNISGDIALKEFSPLSMNFYMRSRGFKVLSQASAASIPTFYGDVVISTSPGDIYFTSDLTNSSLTGDLNIDNARLYMPNKRSTKSTISKIKYEVVGNKINVKLEDSTKSAPIEENLVVQKTNGNGESATQSSFYDGMNMDLDIKILKPIYMDMDLFSLLFTQKLTAEIGAVDQSAGMKLFKERFSDGARLYGELELKKGSKLSFIKVFNTDGTITFPTGNMGDPYLNLTAEYSGVTDMNNTQRYYKVTLRITGSKDMPKIDFNYSIDNEQATGDSTKIREDALFLLIAGRTKSELFSAGGAQANIVNELGNTGLSTAVSTALSQILAGTIIRSADIELSESWEETKLKLTGQLIGNVGWKIGGNVADLMGNNEITIELPLDFIMNNAMLQFTWTTNEETIISKEQKKGELRFKIGNSF